MSYEVKLFRDKDTFQDIKLIAMHGGKQVLCVYSGGEPEDNTFTRDYDWVEGALKNAYRLGKEDGYIEGCNVND